VVLIMFDEFPTTDLLGKHGRIDGTRFPNFARLAGDATWYRNATTVYDTTFSAAPAIQRAAFGATTGAACAVPGAAS